MLGFRCLSGGLMRTLLLALLFAWSLVAGPPAVVVLSCDGLGADQFTSETMPKVWQLAQGGRQGRGLPPFPSTTFTGHATLATGCAPGRHGIVGNSLVDPVEGFVPHTAAARWLQAEPLWIAAARSGVKAAVYHWPCGEGPWRGEAAWRMEPYVPDRTDADALAYASAALKDGARLVMAYLSGVDTEAHQTGPGSPTVRAKLRAMDALLAPWLTAQMTAHPGLRVWLLADHGMAPMRTRIHLPSLLRSIPGRFLAYGGSASLYFASPEDLPRAATLLRAQGLQVWTRGELPEAFLLRGAPRAGDLMVLAPSGSWFSAAETAEEDASERSGRAGAHAYAPTDPGMPTWMVLLGAGSGSLGDVELRDVAPTIAAWLGIRWASPPQGRLVPGLP